MSFKLLIVGTGRDGNAKLLSEEDMEELRRDMGKE